MLRALVARLKMWLDPLIGIAGPRGWQTRPCPLRAADLQAGVEVPLLRHLARMGRPLVGLGAMAPSSLPTVGLMHPTQIAKPFHRAGWIYEEKVDGWRLVATKAGGTVRLVSRNGRDLTGRFPELVKALSGLKPRAFILDGEVAVYDRAFISRFEWLRRRPTDEPATLPVYMAFDLMELDGRDLRRESLKVRRRLLERLVRSHGMVFATRRLSRNGLRAWEEAVARGFEGVVAKNPESRYVPGRTLAWLKVKQSHYREGERAGRRSRSPSPCHDVGVRSH